MKCITNEGSSLFLYDYPTIYMSWEWFLSLKITPPECFEILGGVLYSMLDMMGISIGKKIIIHLPNVQEIKIENSKFKKFLNSILTTFNTNKWTIHSLPQVWNLSNLLLSIFSMYYLVKQESHYVKKDRSDAQRFKTLYSTLTIFNNIFVIGINKSNFIY